MTLDRFHSSDVQINEDLDFSSLVSNPALLNGLTESGYQRPSPIQLKTIPLGRLGLDLIAQAKSGTGKTIVFSVIAIEAVLSTIASQRKNETEQTSQEQRELQQQQKQQQPRAVILAPTREIAVQIQDVILKLISSGLQQVVTCHVMIGGIPIQQDKKNLRECSIVVGTPGRVRSLIETGHLKTSLVRLLVLDEADKLMEDVFKEDVSEIAKGLGSQKQVMAFSATYDEDLLSHLDLLVRNPIYVMLSNGTPELEGVLQYCKLAKLDDGLKSSSVFMKQTLMMQAKFAELESLLTHVPFYQAIVFLNRRTQAADLVKFLTRKGWPALHIASGISQEERLAVMEKARKFELRVLVCSDLIARGIDIDRVNLVVNLDLPKDPETYLHRVGRTGRYGTTGLAVSIVDDAEQKTVEILRRDFGITIQELSTEDRTYSELGRHSQNRHHERPLQQFADQEQFNKLEAERVVGQQRAFQDDETVDIDREASWKQDDHHGCEGERGRSVTSRKRKAPKRGHAERKDRKAEEHVKKRIYSPLSPEMTPSIAESEAEGADNGENTAIEEIQEEVEEEEVVVEEEEEEAETLARENTADSGFVYCHPEAYHSHAYFGSLPPPPPPPPYHPFHPPYPSLVMPWPLPQLQQTCNYQHSVYFPPIHSLHPRPTFFPPDLPLFPPISPFRTRFE